VGSTTPPLGRRSDEWSGLQDSNLRGRYAVCLEGSCHRPLGQARMKRDTPRRMRVAFGTNVPRPSPGRRRDVRANDNPLAALLHGGPVFGIRIVKELHLPVRRPARWRSSKNKKPGGLAHSPGLDSVVLGVWPYGPPPLPGVRARFVSGWPKCKRASPRADIESMLAQTQYGRPLRPDLARGVVSVLRLVELMAHSRGIPCMLNTNLAKVKQPLPILRISQHPSVESSRSSPAPSPVPHARHPAVELSLLPDWRGTR
jgi:hypothetical protein